MSSVRPGSTSSGWREIDPATVPEGYEIYTNQFGGQELVKKLSPGIERARPGPTPDGELKPTDRRFLERYIERSQRPESELIDEAMQGTQEPRGFLAGDSQQREATSLGGPVNQAASDAIQKRALSAFDSEAARMRKNAELQAKVQRQKNISSGLKARIGSAEASLGIMENQLKNRIAEEQARANVLGSVLGVIGTIGGTLLGGPIGGAIGGSVSKGVGKIGYGNSLSQ